MKVCDFGADPKFKMAATVDLSLTLDPMGKTRLDLLLGNRLAK